MRTPTDYEYNFINNYENASETEKNAVDIAMTWIRLAAEICKSALITSSVIAASQQPPLKKGGIVKPINKSGEVITLPSGDLVIPNDIAKDIAKNKDNIKIDIMVNGKFDK